jgi:peptidoglycan L-alanyl-D-glutamate endopeptidase CwlK
MDKVTLQRIDLIHPVLREELHEIYKEICERLQGRVICRFTHTLRTNAEQNALFAKGRNGDKGKIVTYAKGGQSYHNYGLAVDIVLLVDKDGNGTHETVDYSITSDNDGDGIADFDEIDYVFNMYGWKGLYKANGKRWDYPHFQKTFGLTIAQLQKLPVVNGYPIINSI